jgi:hypothetical protein
MHAEELERERHHHDDTGATLANKTVVLAKRERVSDLHRQKRSRG